MRVRPLFLLFAGLAACAPTYQAAPPNPAAQYEAQARAEREARERQENARGWVTFYETYPVLKGREKCVARALNTLSDKTWENLARAAISFCVAPPPSVASATWVKAFTDVNGHSTFVDRTRVELRQDGQVTYWQLVEAFDDERDFFLARVVADCDRKLWAPFQGVPIVSGQYGTSFAFPIEWQSTLPNSQAEAVLTGVCAARTARMKPAAPVLTPP